MARFPLFLFNVIKLKRSGVVLIYILAEMADDGFEFDNSGHQILQLFIVNLDGGAHFLTGGGIFLRDGG